MFNSINEIKQANKRIGHHWFDPDTMSFFNSKIESDVIYGKYFITSEMCGIGFLGEFMGMNPSPTYLRKFSIRIANEDGSIDTVGDFQQFDTLESATDYISKHLSSKAKVG